MLFVPKRPAVEPPKSEPAGFGYVNPLWDANRPVEGLLFYGFGVVFAWLLNIEGLGGTILKQFLIINQFL